ncbi:hypothetical protein [Bacteroides xylanisolvens]|uniref:hypothetical protein n=1 Tax=Bacteroides xylanisolvens TaxID=371601 RepID=UPI0021CEC994|nr:hypothetical protein [Bacteroides xylanisolvens]
MNERSSKVRPYFQSAVRIVPKYKEAARKRIGDDRNPDFENREMSFYNQTLPRR